MTVAEAKAPAIFLDRDGTISSDEYGYISNPEEYRLYPYAGQALRLMKDMGYQLIIVTNQSGIARGYFGIEQLQKVHDRMRQLLLDEGVELDGIYYSPYYKDGVVEPYNIHHEDRKPGIGLYKRALAEHHFDYRKSWMIGDRYTDIAFGKKAGLKTILLLSGNGKEELESGIMDKPFKPDFVVENVFTAARLIELATRKERI